MRHGPAWGAPAASAPVAAPLIAIHFLVTFSLAILSRAAPTINAFLLSLPIQIFAGLTVLGMVAGLTAHYVLSALGGVPELMLRFIADAHARRAPIRFALYWGKGLRPILAARKRVWKLVSKSTIASWEERDGAED